MSDMAADYLRLLDRLADVLVRADSTDRDERADQIRGELAVKWHAMSDRERAEVEEELVK